MKTAFRRGYKDAYRMYKSTGVILEYSNPGEEINQTFTMAEIFMSVVIMKKKFQLIHIETQN